MNMDLCHIRCAIVALCVSAGLSFPARQAAARDAPDHTPSAPVTTSALARTVLRSDVTLRYVEVLQTRGRWVVPDIGYIDFGDAGRPREDTRGSDAWQHRPFVTGTVRLGHAGSRELWGQRLPGDRAQLQVRSAISGVSRPS